MSVHCVIKIHFMVHQGVTKIHNQNLTKTGVLTKEIESVPN